MEITSKKCKILMNKLNKLTKMKRKEINSKEKTNKSIKINNFMKLIFWKVKSNTYVNLSNLFFNYVVKLLFF